jgi:Holliday junction resolvase RusA-like endonuclease
MIITFTVNGKPKPQQRHKHRTIPIKRDIAKSRVGKIVGGYRGGESDPDMLDDIYDWFQQAANHPMQYDPSVKDKESFAWESKPHKPSSTLKGTLGMDLNFYFPRPQSHYGSKDKTPYLKEEHKGTWYDKTPDIDNLRKFVMDALNGLFYEDDKQIVTGITNKFYISEGDEPRTEVIIFKL